MKKELSEKGIEKEIRFNENCDKYRAMRQANSNRSFEKQRDAINKFRSGY